MGAAIGQPAWVCVGSGPTGEYCGTGATYPQTDPQTYSSPALRLPSTYPLNLPYQTNPTFFNLPSEPTMVG